MYKTCFMSYISRVKKISLDFAMFIEVGVDVETK